MNSRINSLVPEFIDSVPMPAEMARGVLYISMRYSSASHKCACGCGQEVVTPLSITGWTLQFNGSVSLNPSIGNQEFPCRSHYWIRSDRIQWLPDFTVAQVQVARRSHAALPIVQPPLAAAKKPSRFATFFRRLFGRS